MGRLIANIVSIVFHPLFVPLYGIYMVFNSNVYVSYTLSQEGQNMIYSLLFFNTCFVPALMVYLLYKKKIISGIKMESKVDRTFPYLIISIFYFVTYYIFYDFKFPFLISSVILGAAISLVALFIINFKQKVSAHMVAAGGLIGVSFGISEIYLHEINVFLIPMILISGIIAYSRLKLKAHQPNEIYLGVALGFFSEYLMFMI